MLENFTPKHKILIVHCCTSHCYKFSN